LFTTVNLYVVSSERQVVRRMTTKRENRFRM